MLDIVDLIRNYGLMLLIGEYPHGPLGGLAMTIILSVVALVLAFPFGILLAMCRTSPIKWLRSPAVVLVYLVRGIPLLMLIFWAYFFLPVLTGHSVSGFSTMIMALVIYEGAYISEIIRAGINGLPKGQIEASRALGLSYNKTTFKIVLPQAIYHMVPALIGQFVSIIKDTSLAYVISLNEVTFVANQINNYLLTQSFQVFMLLAFIYLLLGYLLSKFTSYLENRVSAKRMGLGKLSINIGVN